MAFTKNPDFKPQNYYWYRENGKYSIHLISQQTIQTLQGPQTLFIASNGGYLVSVASMKGEWWDTPIPIPEEATDTTETSNEPQP